MIIPRTNIEFNHNIKISHNCTENIVNLNLVLRQNLNIWSNQNQEITVDWIMLATINVSYENHNAQHPGYEGIPCVPLRESPGTHHDVIRYLAINCHLFVFNDFVLRKWRKSVVARFLFLFSLSLPDRKKKLNCFQVLRFSSFVVVVISKEVFLTG